MVLILKLNPAISKRAVKQLNYKRYLTHQPWAHCLIMSSFSHLLLYSVTQLYITVLCNQAILYCRALYSLTKMYTAHWSDHYQNNLKAIVQECTIQKSTVHLSRTSQCRAQKSTKIIWDFSSRVPVHYNRLQQYWHCTAQFFTVLLCSTLCCTALYCSTLFLIELHCNVLHCILEPICCDPSMGCDTAGGKIPFRLLQCQHYCLI